MDGSMGESTDRRMGRSIDRSEASALADLQMHWDEAYAIGLDGDVWSARFHGSADELRAHTSSELRELIRADYAYRTRASTARGRREADAQRDAEIQREAEIQGEAETQREAEADADASPGGYSAGALAGYGSVDEEAPAGQRLERAEFADLRGERMST